MTDNVDLYRCISDPLPEGYKASYGTREIRLHEMDLFVTMACNIRCEFCSVRAGEYNHDQLPLDRIKEIIDEATELGLEELHFLGGEPTLREDLELMISHASSKGISTRIITNGMLLGKKRIKKLIDHGLGEIVVSIDGLGNVHNQVRTLKSDGWAKSIACVRDAVSLGIRTRVAATAFKTNYNSLIDLMHMVEKIGVNTFSIFLGSPLGRGIDMKDNIVDPYMWKSLQGEIKENLISIREDFNVIMEKGFAWNGEKVDRKKLKGRGTGCETLLDDFDYIIIRSDGNLYQCVFYLTEGKPIGNIASAPLKESLQYALEQKHYLPYTRAIDKCTKCFHQTDCGTGCRGYAFLLKDDWFKTDPRCSKTDPDSRIPPSYYPLCPILKWNARTDTLGGSSEQALEQ